jgi:hypothetical protein
VRGYHSHSRCLLDQGERGHYSRPLAQGLRNKNRFHIGHPLFAMVWTESIRAPRSCRVTRPVASAFAYGS